MGKKWYKKVAKVLHPIGAGLMGDDKKDSSGAWQSLGSQTARQAELDAAMKEYTDAPTMINRQYTDAARRAGTYADTSEFKSGLDSEVLAGTRGARVGIAGRINALKKALGHTDEFKPEGFGETQANITQEAIRNQRTPEETTLASAAEAAPGEAAPQTAVASVQARRGALSRYQTPTQTKQQKFRGFGPG